MSRVESNPIDNQNEFHFINAVRSIIFYLLLSLFTLAWFIPSLLAAFLLPLRARYYFITVLYSKVLIWLARSVCGIKWQIEGLENLPKDGRGYVLLSKHQSTWETFFYNTLIYPQVPVVKVELTYLPVFGWILTMIKPISINRNKKTNALKQVVEQGKERLGKGISVAIYPEGTRVAPGMRKSFSKGGALLATAAKAPVIAIAHNSGEHWPNNSWVKRPGTITVVLSAVIETSELNTNQLNNQTEQWINEQVNKISAIPFSGVYSEAENSGKKF